jgi:nucleotide-binding universal stress UspA family protein
MAALPMLHVLIATDDPLATAVAARTLRGLVDTAALRRVTVLAVAPPPNRSPAFCLWSLVGVVPPAAAEALHAAAVHAAREGAWRVSAELRQRAVRVEPMVGSGVPSEEIVRVAREIDADLIVIGGPARRGWWARLSNRAVPTAVTRAADCPVLIVREHVDEVPRSRGRHVTPGASWRTIFRQRSAATAPLSRG